MKAILFRRLCLQRIISLMLSVSMLWPMPLALASTAQHPSHLAPRTAFPKGKPADPFFEKAFEHLDGIGLVPTMVSLEDGGVLKLIPASDTSEMITLRSLAAQTKGARGYIGVGLRAMASQGWMEMKRVDRGGTHDWEFRWTKDGEIAKDYLNAFRQAASCIPVGIKMDQMLFDSKLSQEQIDAFETVYTYMRRQRWGLPRGEQDPLRERVRKQVLRHLDGIVVGPIMVTLARRGVLNKFDAKGVLPMQTILKLGVGDMDNFLHALDMLELQGWVEPSATDTTLTQEGKRAIKTPHVYGVPVSYYPTLARLHELTFINADPPRYDADGVELLVNRAMNTWGSGEAHKNYFKKMEAVIMQIFDNDDFENQPKGICDVGCGNGTFLKELYDIVKNHTKRGAVLDKYPLKIVGVDYNSVALDNTRKTLDEAGIEHALLRGDIRNPDEIAATLQAEHGLALEDMLSVRSFLDHNRPWESPTDLSDLQPSESTGVFCHRGEEISNDLLELDLRQHFARWAKYLHKFGLVALELHTIPPELAARNRGKTPTIAYDTGHGYSDQYILELPVFLKAAKAAGLEVVESSRRPDSDLATVSISYFKVKEAPMPLIPIPPRAAGVMANERVQQNTSTTASYEGEALVAKLRELAAANLQEDVWDATFAKSLNPLAVLDLVQRAVIDPDGNPLRYQLVRVNGKWRIQPLGAEARALSNEVMNAVQQVRQALQSTEAPDQLRLALEMLFQLPHCHEALALILHEYEKQGKLSEINLPLLLSLAAQDTRLGQEIRSAAITVAMYYPKLLHVASTIYSIREPSAFVTIELDGNYENMEVERKAVVVVDALTLHMIESGNPGIFKKILYLLATYPDSQKHPIRQGEHYDRQAGRSFRIDLGQPVSLGGILMTGITVKGVTFTQAGQDNVFDGLHNFPEDVAKMRRKGPARIQINASGAWEEVKGWSLDEREGGLASLLAKNEFQMGIEAFRSGAGCALRLPFMVVSFPNDKGLRGNLGALVMATPLQKEHELTYVDILEHLHKLDQAGGITREKYMQYLSAMTQTLGAQIRAFHDTGFLHGTPHMENFIIAPEELEKSYWVDFTHTTRKSNMTKVQAYAAQLADLYRVIGGLAHTLSERVFVLGFSEDFFLGYFGKEYGFWTHAQVVEAVGQFMKSMEESVERMPIPTLPNAKDPISRKVKEVFELSWRIHQGYQKPDSPCPLELYLPDTPLADTAA